MSSMTNDTEQKVAIAMLNGGRYQGSMLYIALFHTDPSEAGNMAGEITDPGYRRKPCAATDGAQFTTLDANGIATNKSQITFDAFHDDHDATPITHIGLCSAATGGTVVLKSALSVPRRLLAGAIPFFDVGELRIEFD